MDNTLIQEEKENKIIDSADTSVSKRMTFKNRRFFRKYIELGNATRSYMEVYRVKNRYYAAVKGCLLLKKFPEVRDGLFESRGLDDDSIATVLKEATLAKKELITKGGKIKRYPDHYARLKAVEAFNKMQGRGTEGGVKVQTSIVIVEDRKTNRFEVLDAE